MKQILEQQMQELKRARARNEAAQVINKRYEVEREFRRIFRDGNDEVFSGKLIVDVERKIEPGSTHD